MNSNASALPENDPIFSELVVHDQMANDVAQTSSAFIYRPAIPSDFHELRQAHVEMFPVDYEDMFYQRTVKGEDHLQTLMAIEREPDGNEHLVGFIVARAFKLHECDAIDRELVGLSHKLLDLDQIMYILTLGVSPHRRRCGIASHLIEWIVQKSKDMNCRAVYLHVISYNRAAIDMYRKNNFKEIACRQNFYYIRSGRQPDVSQNWFDAFLYALVINTEPNRTPLLFIMALLAPLRDLFYSLCSLIPDATARSTYFGNANFPSSLPSVPKRIESQDSSTSSSGRWNSRLKSLFSRKEDLRRQ